MLRFVAFALLSATASAQIVVLDGDDLAATCAAAPDGSLIVIQSNETFVGTLSWQNKSLTIRSGVGFAPTIQGDPDSPAVRFGDEAGLILRQVTVAAGEELTLSFIRAIDLSGTSIGVETATVELEDCVVEGLIEMGGTGDFWSDLTLRDTEVNGDLLIGGTGSSRQFVNVFSDCRIGSLLVSPISDGGSEVLVRNSIIEGNLTLDANSDTSVTAVLRRTRIQGNVVVAENDDSTVAETDVLLESCLIVGDGAGTGLFADEFATLRGVNLTVSGFVTGLAAGIGSDFVNCLIFDNDQDLDPVVLPIQISNSLIEDGTYSGFFGNFGGTPGVTDNFRLIEGSLGIDAGDSAAADLGSLDLNGDPRIQDGDGDSVAVVNVGATESVVPCTPASFTLYNGSGINPEILSVLLPPTLGSIFQIEVKQELDTVATIVAIGAPDLSGLMFPGVAGELLLGLAPFPTLDFAAGLHAFPIPNDLNLCGSEAAAQGIRVDLSLSLELTNAVSLTLGV